MTWPWLSHPGSFGHLFGIVGFTAEGVLQCRCRGGRTLLKARGKQESIQFSTATYFRGIFLVSGLFLTFLDNEVWGLFFFSFKLNKANLMDFEKKLKTGFSASNSAKVQASWEYNVKDNPPPPHPQLDYRKFYLLASKLHSSPLCLQSLGCAVCPSDE